MLNQQAPNFSLLASTGEQVTKDDLVGGFAVLIFYPLNDSPTCVRQLDDMNINLADFMTVNARVFGVNTASAEKQKAFCARRRLEFPILADAGGRVSKQFGATFFGLPVIWRTVVVIDPSSKIIYYKKGVPTPQELLDAIQSGAQNAPS